MTRFDALKGRKVVVVLWSNLQKMEKALNTKYGRYFVQPELQKEAGHV